jgi:hypothetical protein
MFKIKADAKHIEEYPNVCRAYSSFKNAWESIKDNIDYFVDGHVYNHYGYSLWEDDTLLFSFDRFGELTIYG